MGVLLVICLFAWIIYRASQEHKEIEKKERAIQEKITKEKYLRNDDPLFKYKQAEILVKTHVPLKYILNIDEF